MPQLAAKSETEEMALASNKDQADDQTFINPKSMKAVRLSFGKAALPLPPRLKIPEDVLIFQPGK